MNCEEAFRRGYVDAFHGKDRSDDYEPVLRDSYREGIEAFYQDYYEGLVLTDEDEDSKDH